MSARRENSVLDGVSQLPVLELTSGGEGDFVVPQGRVLGGETDGGVHDRSMSCFTKVEGGLGLVDVVVDVGDNESLLRHFGDDRLVGDIRVIFSNDGLGGVHLGLVEELSGRNSSEKGCDGKGVSHLKYLIIIITQNLCELILFFHIEML